MPNNLRFLTDPHLGLSRVSHTTSKSQAALRQRLFDICDELIENDATFIVGDLFDSYSNSEDVIAQGFDIANRCCMVLSGNHDIRNRSDVMGSLQLIRQQLDYRAALTQIPLPGTEADDYGIKVSEFFGERIDTLVYGVGHQLSQADFIAAVKTAKQMRDERTDLKPDNQSILLLHCNYDAPSDFIDDGGATLNLPRELAAELLQTFEYVLIGHEHVPSEDFDGKLKVLGNIFPIAFGEMADRFVYDYDIEHNQFEKTKIFDVATGFLQIDANDFLNIADVPVWAAELTQDFVEITGTLRAVEYPEFGRKLSQLWRNAPSLIMVKSAVSMEKVNTTVADAVVSEVKRTIPEVIADELAGSEMASVYSEMLEEERAESGID